MHVNTQRFNVQLHVSVHNCVRKPGRVRDSGDTDPSSNSINNKIVPIPALSMPVETTPGAQHATTANTRCSNNGKGSISTITCWGTTDLAIVSLELHHIHYILSGLVQVQTPEEPELDLKSSSLRSRFGSKEICKADPKSSSRFGEIYP